MSRFEKIAKEIRNLCDQQGFDLSEAIMDLIAKDLLAAENPKNIKMITNVDQGEVFKWCEKEYIKLDNLKDGCLCLAKDILFQSEFDDENKNNWAKSSLRQKLGVVIGDYTIKNELVPFDRDLTTDDGQTDYGSCTDSVSLLTCDEYRKYRKFIPKTDEWHWTITADSLESPNFVRFVCSDGSLDNYDTYFGNGGVRPLICLDFWASVEVEE